MKAINYKSPIYWVASLIFVLLISLSITKPAQAFEDDTDGYIPADQTINDDLFITGEIVIIDGTVNGDVIASAEKLIINGTVNGNLFIYAGTVEINGTIGGSVAFGGQQLVINSPINGSVYAAGMEIILNPEAKVNRNILFAGFSFEALPGSVVGTDIHGTGYQVILGGSVGRNVLVDVEAAEISGKIGGNAEFHVSEPSDTPPQLFWLEFWSSSSNFQASPELLPSGLRIDPEAEIQGQLTYKSSVEQWDTILADPSGGIVFEQTLPTPNGNRSAAQFWFLARLRELLTLLAVGALAFWLIPKAVIDSSSQFRAKPIHSLGWGIIGLIIGYIAILVTAFLLLLLGILLAIVTLGGLAGAVFGIGFSGLVMITGIFTLLVIYGSKIVFAYSIGNLLVSRFSPEGSNLRFLAFVLGIAIYMVFRLIPIVNSIVGIITTLFGLGAMVLAIKNRRQEKMLDAISEEAALKDEL